MFFYSGDHIDIFARFFDCWLAKLNRPPCATWNLTETRREGDSQTRSREKDEGRSSDDRDHAPGPAPLLQGFASPTKRALAERWLRALFSRRHSSYRKLLGRVRARRPCTTGWRRESCDTARTMSDRSAKKGKKKGGGKTTKAPTVRVIHKSSGEFAATDSAAPSGHASALSGHASAPGHHHQRPR